MSGLCLTGLFTELELCRLLDIDKDTPPPLVLFAGCQSDVRGDILFVPGRPEVDLQPEEALLVIQACPASLAQRARDISLADTRKVDWHGLLHRLWVVVLRPPLRCWGSFVPLFRALGTDLKKARPTGVRESPCAGEIWVQHGLLKTVHIAMSSSFASTGADSLVTSCGRACTSRMQKIDVLSNWTLKCRVCFKGRRQP